MEQPVTDRASLGVALRAIKDAQSRIAECIATHAAELKRIELWLSGETAMDYALIQNWTALIRPYAIAEAERQVAMGGHKRVSVPDGDCEVRDQPPEVRRVDEEELTLWAVDQGLTRQPPIPDREICWNEIRKMALAGSHVPGVEVVPREPSVTVKVAS